MMIIASSGGRNCHFVISGLRSPVAGAGPGCGANNSGLEPEILCRQRAVVRLVEMHLVARLQPQWAGFPQKGRAALWETVGCWRKQVKVIKVKR